ncbi:GNAT family N-acetyltransferase [Candidatus Thorarchaeota archaeon]|nr:MAG: GNAT family N-acetyltransferase [Candidatus Thorarchaeota archaeon]
MNIRSLLSSDIDFALDLTMAEGWTSTRSDFEELLLFNPNGCFIAEIGSEPMGMVCSISYGPFGFVGNLIVRPEYRGEGRGFGLMESAMHYLQSRGTSVVMLDAVSKAVSLYERLGFEIVCRSLRLAGTVKPKSSPRMHQMDEKFLKQVLSLDQKLFGGDRSLFLKKSLEKHPDLSLVCEGDNELVGFMMGSRRHGHVRLAPWAVSESPGFAQEMLPAFAEKAGSTTIRLGVLENNENAVRLLEDHGFHEQSHSWRMVKGVSPDAVHLSDGIYAIGSPMRG